MREPQQNLHPPKCDQEEMPLLLTHLVECFEQSLLGFVIHFFVVFAILPAQLHSTAPAGGTARRSRAQTHLQAAAVAEVFCQLPKINVNMLTDHNYMMRGLGSAVPVSDAWVCMMLTWQVHQSFVG
jgi:hypothetical protein